MQTAQPLPQPFVAVRVELFKAASMSHHQFCFQQVGGRCKLLGAGEIVPGIAPATPEQIRASQQRRAEQRRGLKEQCTAGGRCELLGDGDVVPGIMPTNSGQIRASQQRRAEQRRALKEQRSKARRELDWKAVKEFLDLHQFSDVNAVKVSRFGLKRSYPMKVALRQGDMRMMQLLSKFGATCAVAGSEASLVSGAGGA
ncbi:unnamed protein product [Durusdinium trenchii]|uniref:Uncharacterized protein n=1 Tax=Durusdinium trenchii TaxID=1381693 RepID=A0ABP0SX50_9DINO